MPSVADILVSPMSKKRRRDDLEPSLRLSSPHYSNENRTILPRPKRRLDTGIKRQRIERPSSFSHYDEEVETRTPLSDMTSHQPDPSFEKKFSGRVAGGGKVDLSPCHICHRKPTEKRQLEDYADCEGCCSRTCFICMRECKGLYLHGQAVRGDDVMVVEDLSRYGVGEEEEKTGPWEKGRLERHRGMICSRCCVERGSEGEVWCLGCWKSEGGG